MVRYNVWILSICKKAIIFEGSISEIRAKFKYCTLLKNMCSDTVYYGIIENVTGEEIGTIERSSAYKTRIEKMGLAGYDIAWTKIYEGEF